MNGTSQKCQDFNCASWNYFFESDTITLAYLPIIFGITASLTHNILIDYFKIVILHEFTIANQVHRCMSVQDIEMYTRAAEHHYSV